MMFTVLSGFFKKLFGFDITTIFVVIMLAMVAAVVIPNYSKVLGFFGYETRAVLKEQRDTAIQNTEVAVNVNTENKKVVEVLEKTTKNVEDTIVEVVVTEKKIAKRNTELKEKKDKKVEDIKNAPNKPKEVQEREISEVQITSLWDNYCGFNSNELCKTNTSTGT